MKVSSRSIQSSYGQELLFLFDCRGRTSDRLPRRAVAPVSESMEGLSLHRPSSMRATYAWKFVPNHHGAAIKALMLDIDGVVVNGRLEPQEPEPPAWKAR